MGIGEASFATSPLSRPRSPSNDLGVSVGHRLAFLIEFSELDLNLKRALTFPVHSGRLEVGQAVLAPESAVCRQAPAVVGP
jgi:hypothetical protein